MQGKFSFSPDSDAELPVVPVPQRVMLHPHQLPISTIRELLERIHGGSVPKLKQENPRRATRSRVIELTDRICVCRHGATVRNLVHGGRYTTLSVPRALSTFEIYFEN